MNITINSDLSARIVSDDGKRVANLPNYNPETLVPFMTEDEVTAFIRTRVTNAYFIPLETPEAASNDLQGQIVQAAQQRLDDFAKTRGYDSILSAATYATSSIEKFAIEGQRAVDLRDQTWVTLYTILDEVNAGTRPAPTSFADIEGELPELTWE